MKYLKFIMPIVVIAGVISILSVIKYNADWQNDFSPYSSGLLRSQAYYVRQPATNMINEEQMPTGQSETDEGIYYFTMVRNSTSEYRVYYYDKTVKETRLIYEVVQNDSNGMLIGVSSNGRKLLLVFNNRIVLVDLITSVEKEILNNQKDCISVTGQDLLYINDDDMICRINLKTGKSECIDGIRALRFVLYEDKIYYEEKDNEGNVMSYNPANGEITSVGERIQFGFFIEDGELCFK